MGRLIGIVTSSRADFGPLAPLMSAVKADPNLDLVVYATGMHFSTSHGTTVQEIVEKGFADELVEVRAGCPEGGDAETALAMGEGVQAFSRAFSERRPGILVVMGDRFDMFPAPVAAIAFNIPIAHISGGEITEGVIDDVIRHATSKISHLHFASMETYAENLRQMGEEPWRVHVVGEPGLDVAKDYPEGTRSDFLSKLGFDENRPVTLFTYHPESLFPKKSAVNIEAALKAAEQMETQILFTAPNNDPGSAEIRDAILRFAERHSCCRVVESLGRRNFFNALAFVDCMVGNSSAGIVETASFELPTVNIGDRQKGRRAPANVIESPGDTESVRSAWNRALSPTFREQCRNVVNPYGDGHASKRIVAHLKSVALDARLLRKKFHAHGGETDAAA